MRYPLLQSHLVMLSHNLLCRKIPVFARFDEHSLQRIWLLDRLEQKRISTIQEYHRRLLSQQNRNTNIQNEVGQKHVLKKDKKKREGDTSMPIKYSKPSYTSI